MSFHEYVQTVRYWAPAYPQWREGQLYFNILCDVRPDLAEHVRGEYRLDPFYRDGLVPDFLEFVGREW